MPMCAAELEPRYYTSIGMPIAGDASSQCMGNHAKPERHAWLPLVISGVLCTMSIMAVSLHTSTQPQGGSVLAVRPSTLHRPTTSQPHPISAAGHNAYRPGPRPVLRTVVPGTIGGGLLLGQQAPAYAAEVPAQVQSLVQVPQALLQGDAVQSQIAYATAHPTEVGIVGALLLTVAIVWNFRRTILWKLSQAKGYPEDVEMIANKYVVEETPVIIGNSSSRFGVVSPMWNQKQRWAIKISRDDDSYQRESAAFKRLGNGGGPVVSVYDSISNWDGQNSNIIVQECGERDLLDYIRAEGALPNKEIKKFAKQALSAIEKFHGAGLVWCDCKPENFIIVKGRIKAIDLETASREGTDIPGFTSETAPPELADWEKPPRLSDGLSARKSYDIWSFGMLVLHMYLGRPYWGKAGNQAILRDLRKLHAQDVNLDLSMVEDAGIRNLVKRCCQTDPNKRPSVAMLKLDPFLLF